MKNMKDAAPPSLSHIVGDQSSINQLYCKIHDITELNEATLQMLNELTYHLKDFILYRNVSKIIYTAYDNLSHLDKMLSIVGKSYLLNKDPELLRVYKRLSVCIADEATCWLSIAVKVGKGATFIPQFFDKNCIKALFDYGVSFHALDPEKTKANRKSIELLMKQFGLYASLSDYTDLINAMCNSEINSLILSTQISHPEIIAELGGLEAINSYVSSIKTYNTSDSNSLILSPIPEMLEGNSSMVVSGETDKLNYLLEVQASGTLTADQQEELNSLSNKFQATYGIQPTLINTINIIGTVNTGISGGQYGTSSNPSGSNVLNTSLPNIGSLNIPMPNNLDSIMGGIVTDALGITDSNSWNSLMGVFDGIVNDVNSYINNAISTVTGMIGDFLDNLVSFVSAVLGQLFGVFRRPVGTALIDGYSNYLFSEISDAYYNTIGEIIPDSKFEAKPEINLQENIDMTDTLIGLGGKMIDKETIVSGVDTLNPVSLDNALYSTLLNDLIVSHSTTIVAAEQGIVNPDAIDTRIDNYKDTMVIIDKVASALTDSIYDLNGVNNAINNYKTLVR